MGQLSGSMVSGSAQALLSSDIALAQRVISDDTVMDAKQRELDDRSITLIAKRQPMAQDLRSVVGAIRMAADLERIGDLAKNIASIGDHVTNIAENAYYVITGSQLPPFRPKLDETAMAVAD